MMVRRRKHLLSQDHQHRRELLPISLLKCLSFKMMTSDQVLLCLSLKNRQKHKCLRIKNLKTAKESVSKSPLPMIKIYISNPLIMSLRSLTNSISTTMRTIKSWLKQNHQESNKLTMLLKIFNMELLNLLILG